jgi:hypothetical protein
MCEAILVQSELVEDVARMINAFPRHKVGGDVMIGLS